MLVGSARVSTIDQDPGYQVLALENRGCEKDFIREGDALVVWRFDRLARSTPEVLALASDLQERGCELVSLTEAIDTSTPGGKVVFTVMAALAQFEVDLNSARTKEAYRAKKAAGQRWGRRSVFHDAENVRIAKALLADPSIPRKAIAERFGVQRQTLYSWFPGGSHEAFSGRPQRRVA